MAINAGLSDWDLWSPSETCPSEKVSGYQAPSNSFVQARIKAQYCQTLWFPKELEIKIFM